ncbi:uncharacterized protein LOC124255632 [Haliotis rubra]|uniref:uncharacterized protein LOC124255632 n=1 Tax=Haliotis rubra TaxID=36100 RepID=UPI001EE60EE5|nr:uncharacterized protein LOC124255632 [Haliotis rubra]
MFVRTVSKEIDEELRLATDEEGSSTGSSDSLDSLKKESFIRKIRDDMDAELSQAPGVMESQSVDGLTKLKDVLDEVDAEQRKEFIESIVNEMNVDINEDMQKPTEELKNTEIFTTQDSSDLLHTEQELHTAEGQPSEMAVIETDSTQESPSEPTQSDEIYVREDVEEAALPNKESALAGTEEELEHTQSQEREICGVSAVRNLSSLSEDVSSVEGDEPVTLESSEVSDPSLALLYHLETLYFIGDKEKEERQKSEICCHHAALSLPHNKCKRPMFESLGDRFLRSHSKCHPPRASAERDTLVESKKQLERQVSEISVDIGSDRKQFQRQISEVSFDLDEEGKPRQIDRQISEVSFAVRPLVSSASNEEDDDNDEKKRYTSASSYIMENYLKDQSESTAVQQTSSAEHGFFPNTFVVEVPSADESSLSFTHSDLDDSVFGMDTESEASKSRLDISHLTESEHEDNTGFQFTPGMYGYREPPQTYKSELVKEVNIGQTVKAQGDEVVPSMTSPTLKSESLSDSQKDDWDVSTETVADEDDEEEEFIDAESVHDDILLDDEARGLSTSEAHEGLRTIISDEITTQPEEIPNQPEETAESLETGERLSQIEIISDEINTEEGVATAEPGHVPSVYEDLATSESVSAECQGATALVSEESDDDSMVIHESEEEITGIGEIKAVSDIEEAVKYAETFDLQPDESVAEVGEMTQDDACLQNVHHVEIDDQLPMQASDDKKAVPNQKHP